MRVNVSVAPRAVKVSRVGGRESGWWPGRPRWRKVAAAARTPPGSDSHAPTLAVSRLLLVTRRPAPVVRRRAEGQPPRQGPADPADGGRGAGRGPEGAAGRARRAGEGDRRAGRAEGQARAAGTAARTWRSTTRRSATRSSTTSSSTRRKSPVAKKLLEAGLQRATELKDGKPRGRPRPAWSSAATARRSTARCSPTAWSCRRRTTPTGAAQAPARRLVARPRRDAVAS